jgi:hypothetical protein
VDHGQVVDGGQVGMTVGSWWMTVVVDDEGTATGWRRRRAFANA